MLTRLSRALGVRGRDINFLFVTNRAIRVYNRKFLKHDHATDVIAFPMEEGEALGDIVISADTAKKQASEQGHSLFTEVKILAIHGLLHLMGYRDGSRSEKARMWKKTYALLGKARGI